jgi:hypothetical protein
LTALVDGPLTAPTISARTGITERQVRAILTSLDSDGKVRNLGPEPAAGRAGRRPTLWALPTTTGPDGSTDRDPDDAIPTAANVPGAVPGGVDSQTDEAAPSDLSAPAPHSDVSAPAPVADDPTPGSVDVDGQPDGQASPDPDLHTPDPDIANDEDPSWAGEDPDGLREEGGVDDAEPADSIETPAAPDAVDPDPGVAGATGDDGPPGDMPTPDPDVDIPAQPVAEPTPTPNADSPADDEPADMPRPGLTPPDETAAPVSDQHSVPTQAAADSQTEAAAGEAPAAGPVCAALTCPLAACPARAGATPSAPRRSPRTRSATSSAPQLNPSGTTRLAPGALGALIVNLLRDNPEMELSAGDIARELTRSSGAVAAAMPKLIAAGQAVQVNPGARPARYKTATGA